MPLPVGASSGWAIVIVPPLSSITAPPP